MLPRTYSSDGIILARKNYSESDRILIIYSKTFGKLFLLAKGVRKPKSRKRGHIEVFSRVKFFAARGKALGIITEAQVVDPFSSIRRDLKKVAVAYFFVEVIGRMSREGEKNEAVYFLLKNFLERLKSGARLKDLKDEFIYTILVNLGFWPKGKILKEPDRILEEVLERPPFASRVGKKLIVSSKNDCNPLD